MLKRFLFLCLFSVSFAAFSSCGGDSEEDVSEGSVFIPGGNELSFDTGNFCNSRFVNAHNDVSHEARQLSMEISSYNIDNSREEELRKQVELLRNAAENFRDSHRGVVCDAKKGGRVTSIDADEVVETALKEAENILDQLDG